MKNERVISVHKLRRKNRVQPTLYDCATVLGILRGATRLLESAVAFNGPFDSYNLKTIEELVAESLDVIRGVRRQVTIEEQTRKPKR